MTEELTPSGKKIAEYMDGRMLYGGDPSPYINKFWTDDLGWGSWFKRKDVGGLNYIPDMAHAIYDEAYEINEQRSKKVTTTWGDRDKYVGKTVTVGRNHEDVTNQNSAIYLRAGNGTIGVEVHPDEARTIAAALIEAADEFDALVEASKPKLPTEPGLYISADGIAEPQHEDIYRLSGRQWYRTDFRKGDVKVPLDAVPTDLKRLVVEA